VPEGANVEGVAILEFASVEAAKAWYNSAANQIRCRIALWPTKQRHALKYVVCFPEVFH
jgi:uncharacterized protein (DUF1330 family)